MTNETPPLTTRLYQASLRLRQICIVTSDLEAVTSDLREIFEIEISLRNEEGLRRFGLENAVFVVGNDFLEIQAPIGPNTAAGRFIRRTNGHGGYNVVLEVSDDVDRRQRRAEEIGTRIALEINRELYRGVQLHPRDCRATMIEFARPTPAGHREGGWWPAGPKWRDYVRTTNTKRVLGIELESPTPADLAIHWSNILGTPLDEHDGDPTIVLDNGKLRFVEGQSECLGAIVLEVIDLDGTISRAVARGYDVHQNSFHLGGVFFRLREPVQAASLDNPA